MADDRGTGPRLSDLDFFTQAVDTTREGLEGIPAAAARGDVAAARRLFAAEARRGLQPDRFLRIKRVIRGNSILYPGESVAEAAERILRLELISCSTPCQFAGEVDWFANPTFNQYREWTWQLSRHAEWAILGERYRETGDERFAEGFVRLFQSWVRQAVAPEDAPGNATHCWRTIEAGIRMGGSWQWALHSFYRSPHFTDDVLVDWYKSVWEHGWRLRHFHRTHNWLIMEMNGLAQIGILYPRFRESDAWRGYAFDRLAEELHDQVYPDGFQYELSTGYHQVVVRNYQWLWDVCEAYDLAVPAVWRTGLEGMHAANVLLMMPDGRLPDLNDGGWAKVAPMMERAAEQYPARADFRWAASRGRDGAPPAETSLAFPHAGCFVMRSGWEPEAVWALFDGGPFGAAHQHEDKLHLLLHAYGRLLLTEGGNYAYDDSEMRRYVLSTRAHNTIRVDGQDQNRRLHFRREEIDIGALAPASWRTTDRYDVAAAAYDEGYGPEATHAVTHRRRVIFLKQGYEDLGACFLVVDRMLPNDERSHEYEALWHFDAETAETDGLTAQSCDPGEPNLTILPADLAGIGVEIIRGQESPEWQGWKAIKDHQQGQYVGTPTAIYRWSAAGPVRLVTLLYPTPAGETCPVRSMVAGTGVDETVVELTLVDGGRVELNEADFASDAPSS